jgi:hypothetical protein
VRLVAGSWRGRRQADSRWRPAGASLRSVPSLVSLWRDLSLRARVGASVAAAAVLLGLPLVLVGPVVRAKVSARAVPRGLAVEVDQVRLGWGGVWLLGVGVHGRQGRVRGTIDAVFVPTGDGPIEVHGGRFALRGTPQELERALAPDSAGTPGSGARRELVADGVSVRWVELESRGWELSAWGFAAARRLDGDVIRLDLARVTGPGANFEARGLGVSLAPRGPLRLRKVSVARAEAAIDLDAVRASARNAAASNAGALGSATPPSPMPASSVPPAASGAVPSTAPPRAAYALGLSALSEVAKQATPEGAELHVRSALVALRFQGEELGFGPSELRVRREAEGLALELTPSEGQATGATALALRAKVPLGAGPTSVELEGGPLNLSALGVRDGELGLTHTREATLEAHLRVEIEGGVIRGSGSGALANLSLQRRELGPREVRGLTLGFRAEGEAALDGSRVSLRDSEVSLGEVRFAGKLELERDQAGTRVELTGGVPLASCGAVVSSIPEAMLTEARGLKLEGTFSLDHSLVYDSARPSALALSLRVENGCRVVEAPDALSPERFRSVWVREVKGPEGLPVEIRSGPGTPEWLSYEEIPRVMEIAVLVCEDGGFYRHRGFDFRAIEKALKDDILAGRFVRGASTISMQLAKNLYLGKEKTLSRKIEEALFTMLLESKLSKQELMALYLNVVELGPGIYGIQQAAKYYFDQPAQELSLGQALYLASILPDPTRQHFQPDGSVSPRWAEYIKKLMRIARSVDRITDEELEAGLAEELAFRKGNGSSEVREPRETEPASNKPDDGFGSDGVP